MGGEVIRHDNSLESILRHGSPKPRSLGLEDLRRITNNFSNEQLLGKGGFCMVYKGVLPNGEIVAVKKFAPPSPGVQNRHFENEVDHLMRLNHPNIVLLLGCCTESDREYVEHNGKLICVEKPEMMVCLEFMPKGSLCGYLSDESSGLTWDIRHKIISDICCGLHYLHEEWDLNSPIIHMDLKPTNILLDNNMVPKIADFGLSRLFADKTRICTASRHGILGYMAPEYINRGIISKKADIFSLGVIILEIITGNRSYPDDTQKYPPFIDLVLGKWRERLKTEQEYTSLEIHCQQITRCIHIGLLCVKLDLAKRPTTGQIIEMLDSNIKEHRMCPTKMEMSGELGAPCSLTSSELQTVWTSPRKRPARRTKFRETRHPVFRGVRWRGNAGRWVCEVRVPGRRGCRLRLGTFDAAEAAARAHDAAMLAIDGSGACLNFADSAWLLAMPASYRSLEDVRHAVAEAVQEFLRRETHAKDDDARSAMSSTPSSPATGSEDAIDSDFVFVLDDFSDMSWDLYYASLAQRMLMEPPSFTTQIGDDNVADVPLWSN